APAAAAARRAADPAGRAVRAGVFPRRAAPEEPYRNSARVARIHAGDAAVAAPESAQRGLVQGQSVARGRRAAGAARAGAGGVGVVGRGYAPRRGRPTFAGVGDVARPTGDWNAR